MPLYCAEREMETRTSVLPQWFLQHCVRLREEAKLTPSLLNVRNNAPEDADDDSALHVAEAVYYEIHEVVYEPLLDLIHKERANVTESNITPQEGGLFSHDSVCLQLPDKYHDDGGQHFLTAVVHQFARDAEADLITLDTDTFDDLADHFLWRQLESEAIQEVSSKSNQRDSNQSTSGSSVADSDQESGTDDASAESTCEEAAEDIGSKWHRIHAACIEKRTNLQDFPFTRLLSAPSLKRLRLHKSATPNVPIVVHLPEAHNLEVACPGPGSTGLREALRDAQSDIIVVATSSLIGRGSSPWGHAPNMHSPAPGAFQPQRPSCRRRRHQTHQAQPRYASTTSYPAPGVHYPNASSHPYPTLPPPAPYPFSLPYRAPGPFPAPVQYQPYFPQLQRDQINTQFPIPSHPHTMQYPSMTTAERWAMIGPANGTRPRAQPICLLPCRNQPQRLLWSKHAEIERSRERQNIRIMKRTIRRYSQELRMLQLVQPFTEWDFFAGSETQSVLAREGLTTDDLHELFSAINGYCDEKSIKRIILRIGKRREIVAQSVRPGHQRQHRDSSRWSNFTREAQMTLDTLEMNVHYYKWENSLLFSLIDPDQLQARWPDIALDDGTRNHVQELFCRTAISRASAYGTLKHGWKSSMLLYGSAGVGKSHLLRIIAREMGLHLLYIPAAALEAADDGHSGQGLRALLNLGRLLEPSLVVISDADMLVSPACLEDVIQRRSRAMQMTHQLDGFRKHQHAVFVVVVTEMPGELSDVLLHRIPDRIHIGLPVLEVRRQILEICLKDETLDDDLDLGDLARRLRGYSASDIRNICVRAALSCDSFTDDKNRKRVLKSRHFEKVLQRYTPRVSQDVLSHIKDFARKHDPATYKTIERDEVDD